MQKTDFKKTLKQFYAPKNTDWQEVEVPELQYLMIDGAGNPNTATEYADAVAVLYSIAYPLKFMSKRELGKDYTVMPLEGLWYADDMSVFEKFDKDAYKWTMMIMQPEWITTEMFEKVAAAANEKNPDLPHKKVRLQSLSEGRCMQLFHIGSYDDEAPKLSQLHHEIMPGQKLDFNGHHHEIYLSDPRRVAPEKLKTILRQPITQRA